jgi:hypothetical protein
MLGLVKKKPPASVGIAEAVDSCDLEWRRNWISSLSVQDLPDLCPMLFALSKSVEVGGGEGWTAAFEHATGLSIDGKLAPVRVALQIYQEALLVRALAKE